MKLRLSSIPLRYIEATCYRNDLTPCRMALYFDYASARAPTPSKHPASTATRGVVVHRSTYVTLPVLLRSKAESRKCEASITLDSTALHRGYLLCETCGAIRLMPIAPYGLRLTAFCFWRIANAGLPYNLYALWVRELIHTIMGL